MRNCNTLNKFQVNQQPLKLLGFWIDTKFTRSVHIDKLCNRISRVTYLLWKLRDIISLEYLKTCYFYLPSIEYIMWCNCLKSLYCGSENITDLKRVLRTICKGAPRDHCRPLFIQIKILTIITKFYILIFVKSNIHIVF